MTLTNDPLAPRGVMPPGAGAYSEIGPFDAASLPKGLLAEHRLKPGTWALVNVLEGAIRFAWDDETGGQDHLVAPAQIIVPPQVLHHVEGDGPFLLTITFHRV